MRQQAVIPGFVPHTASNDRRMDFETLCKLHHRKRRRIILDPTGVPHVRGDEPFVGPFVGFILLGIPPNAFHVTQREVIDKGFIARVRHMSADMRELVQQAEPEIIQPVVAEAETNYGVPSAS
jgi:hypothetical protein